jgi:hypothetical protein
MTLFRAFTIRSFALLWSGQTISRMGESLYTITLAWWVLQKTASSGPPEALSRDKGPSIRWSLVFAPAPTTTRGT